MLCHAYLLGLFVAASMVAAKPKGTTSDTPYPTSSEADDKVKTKKSKTKDTFSTGGFTYSSVPFTYTPPYTYSYTSQPPYTPSYTTQEPPSSTSSTPPPTCTTNTFKLTVVLKYDYGTTAPPINGNYLSAVPYNGGDILKTETDPSLASIFTLNADCSLSYGASIAALPAGAADSSFKFLAPGILADGGFYNAVCTSDGVGLSCSINTGSYYTNSVLYTCSSGPDYYVTIGVTERPYQSYCYTLGFRLAPI